MGLRANVYQYWPFIIFLLIGTCYGVAAARQIDFRKVSTPTHSNFLRERRRVQWCANDPTVCLDPAKNPWGGSTCCFQQFCKNTMSDSNHCGGCGRACPQGLVCCSGKCVDIRNDPHNCGSCFEECPGQNRCSYAMCDYGG